MTTNGRAAWTADLSLLSDDALEEVNRLWTITQVLSNTAHAVKNSLQVTGGNAEMMEAREGLDPALLRRAQTIRAQAARASDALESLLAYSRPSSPSVDVVELGELTRVALDMRAHSLSRARIVAEVKGSEDGPYFARTRRRELLQLLLNVLLGDGSRVLRIVGESPLTVGCARNRVSESTSPGRKGRPRELARRSPPES